MVRTIWQRLGPVPGVIPRSEVLTAATGAGLGILTAGLVLRFLGSWHEFGLIGPFGASAVLIFAFPRSPLGQPFAVVVGNSAAALVGLGTAWLLPWPLIACAVALTLSIAVNALLRATHPPSGGVAVLVGLSAGSAAPFGLGFVASPVALGSLALVLAGLAWHRLTGRNYPMP